MEKKDVLTFASVLDESLGDGIVVKVASITTELVCIFVHDTFTMQQLGPVHMR